MRFASLLSGEFTTMAVLNQPEKKLETRTSVDWTKGPLFSRSTEVVGVVQTLLLLKSNNTNFI